MYNSITHLFSGISCQFTVILIVVYCQVLSAQLFSEGGSGNMFAPVSSASVSFADVNNNGSPDLLISGSFSLDSFSTTLYFNNGGGDFTKAVNTPFFDLFGSGFAFGDVDGDGDLDLIMTGRLESINSGNNMSILYLNDGQGNFTEASGQPFAEVYRGSVVFADVNGNGNLDVFISGADNFETPVSKLYINDGQGLFTERLDVPFEGVSRSSVAFADVDGDGDQDLMITGRGESDDPISKLYVNDGTGEFAEQTNASFEAVSLGSIAFADVDGDGDQDLLISGTGNDIGPITKLYLNDGFGNFTERTDTSFAQVEFGSLAFSDVDGDGDLDLMLTGRLSLIDRFCALYINDGSGNFSEWPQTPFEQVSRSAIAFADVNSNGNPDLLITGSLSGVTPSSVLYLNEGTTSFSGEPVTGWVDFQLFPNPVTGERLNVIYPSREEPRISFEIYDLNGRLMIQNERKFAGNHDSFSIDISGLPPGSYLLQFKDGVRSGAKRFNVY